MQCPFEHLAGLRERAPVYQVEGLPFFLVSRYEDVIHVARHPEIFSSGRGATAYEAVDFFSTEEDVKAVYASAGPSIWSLAYTDPPVHSRHRRLVSRWFTPRQINERWQPVIDRQVDEMITKFERAGRVEFMNEFAIPLPIQVISEILGVTTDRVADFKRWSDADMKAPAGATTHEQWMERAHAHVEMSDFLNAEIDDRLRHPSDDLMGELVRATQEVPESPDADAPLNRYEVLSMVQQMLVAGNETTTQLLGETMRLLLTNPEVLDSLRRDPELVPAVVDEGLRHTSPVIGNFRSATVDTEISGVAIPAGAIVGIMWARATTIPRSSRIPRSFVSGARTPSSTWPSATECTSASGPR